RLQLAAKQAIDVVASAIALALLSPILLVIALLVKMGSPGPVLFRRERVGASASIRVPSRARCRTE
ncbi:hypothetical protein LCGC14_2753190, partial [marine sediment metagenome]